MGIVNFLYSNSRTAEIFRRFLHRLRLYWIYNIVYMAKKRYTNPVPDEMIHSRDFFLKESDRVINVNSWLADKKSQDTYQSVIRLRQFYRVEDIPKYCYFDQYFPKDIPEFSQMWGSEECMIDCGAFNGDSIIAFIKNVQQYKRIIAFEPDPRNIEQLKKRKIQKMEILPVACGDYDGEISFDFVSASASNHISSILSDNSTKVKINKIDSVINEEIVTFIKMDIEGAELSALKGAESTIKRCKPKLAICIYHSDEDMVRIPEYIHSLVPEYNMYVRAHTMGIAETVLYCVCNTNDKNEGGGGNDH